VFSRANDFDGAYSNTSGSVAVIVNGDERQRGGSADDANELYVMGPCRKIVKRFF
jgi:hypothetical protein